VLTGIANKAKGQREEQVTRQVCCSQVFDDVAVSNFSVEAISIGKEKIRQTFVFRSRSTFMHQLKASSSLGLVIHFRAKTFCGFTRDTCHSPVGCPSTMTGLAAAHRQHRSRLEESTSSDGGFHGVRGGAGGFGSGILP
jgi:hypothetical protein